MADKPEKTQSFEKALARLEEIAAEMESGELGLEKMVAAFEEGQKLVKLCSSKRNEGEKKSEQLDRHGTVCRREKLNGRVAKNSPVV